MSLAAFIPFVGPLLDKVLDLIPDPAARERARLEFEQGLASQAHERNMGQIELTKTEATHQSVFVAGWRPAIGWVCAMGLFCYFVPMGVMASVLWVKASWAAQAITPYPVDSGALTELVYALLGLGTLRTIEKTAGKTAGKAR